MAASGALVDRFVSPIWGIVRYMADEVDRERTDRLRVLPGGREDGPTEGREREPGREAAGQDRRTGERADPAGQATQATQADLHDRQEREARDRQLRREGARTDERREGPLGADDRRALRETAADLRNRAGDDRAIVRGEDDQRLAWEGAAAGHEGSERSADLGRANWLGADANRRERTARADEARADSLDAEADTAEAAPPRVQEPTRDRLSPTDGTQSPAHQAVATRPNRPAARSGRRTANQLNPKQRDGRDR